jgi:glycosyltransferase involved in cell wall biosynthesis
MRLLYVIQRYGEGVFGGAEQHCRDFAERMVARGHDVNVLTTCALSYVDWANHFAPGQSDCNGVTVRRVPVRQKRHGELFASFNARMVHRRRLAPRELQLDWMRMQGPYAPDLPRWLERNARQFDCVVCITYLYWTTWAALTTIAGAVPTVLHPTAHDEPPLRLSLFDEVFRLPHAFAYLTPEEAALVARRFPGAPDGDVVGVGVELDRRGDGDAFRRAFGIGARPYLCYVGRIDPAKGAAELLEFFTTYKDRNPSDLALVFVGQPVMDLPERDDIVVTGFVEEADRDNAIAGALALVHPSYFESFSMVLTESFAQQRPALVQGRCEVMVGHAARSGAAIPYSGFAEFEAAVGMLFDDRARADEMGRRGRAYVEREYAWDHVLDRYEALLHRTVDLAGREARTG